MARYTTIVLCMPEDSKGLAQVEEGLRLLRPYQVAASLEDEMTLLEQIEAHEDFPEHIAAEVRARLKSS